MVVFAARYNPNHVGAERRSEVIEILRQRLASGSRIKARPAEDFFNEFFAKNNIPVED